MPAGCSRRQDNGARREEVDFDDRGCGATGVSPRCPVGSLRASTLLDNGRTPPITKPGAPPKRSGSIELRAPLRHTARRDNDAVRRSASFSDRRQPLESNCHRRRHQHRSAQPTAQCRRAARWSSGSVRTSGRTAVPLPSRVNDCHRPVERVGASRSTRASSLRSSLRRKRRRTKPRCRASPWKRRAEVRPPASGSISPPNQIQRASSERVLHPCHADTGSRSMFSILAAASRTLWKLDPNTVNYDKFGCMCSLALRLVPAERVGRSESRRWSVGWRSTASRSATVACHSRFRSRRRNAPRPSPRAGGQPPLCDGASDSACSARISLKCCARRGVGDDGARMGHARAGLSARRVAANSLDA